MLIIRSADQYQLILANFMVIGISSNQHTFRILTIDACFYLWDTSNPALVEFLVTPSACKVNNIISDW